MQTNNTLCCMKNRELSWLDFNERVLELASRQGILAYDRLKFISIFTTNFDEFYMVRVGSLLDNMAFAPKVRENKTGMTAEEQLGKIFKRSAELYDLRRWRFMSVRSELSDFGIKHSLVRELDEGQKKKLEKYFTYSILPLLSAQIVDNRHPFPHMVNKQLHVAVTLVGKNRQLCGIIAVPQSIERIIAVERAALKFVLLEDVICHFAHLIFNMYRVVERTVVTVTRNADIDTEEGLLDEDIDYRQFMKRIIKKRNRLAPVRLELQDEVSEAFSEYFLEKLSLKPKQSFYAGTPLDFTYCFQLADKLDSSIKEQVMWPTFVPSDSRFADMRGNMAKAIQRKDVLLAYPFESMNPFLRLIRQSADDPSVLSIKITLYRLDRKSRLAEILTYAAENGKEVVVVMELRARFDEDNNIEWAQRLDEAGCRVMYGPAGYKVHAKICLITRREHGKVSYVTHIGTGNYNEKTAKLYTDLSIISAGPELGKDAARFFVNLMLGNLEGEYTHLIVAPYGFKRGIIEYIGSETSKSEKGEQGRIILKCNSLTDKEIIEELIRASQGGVKVTLLIRGICCIVPGVSGLTDNIEVISIVGRFLEHSRIFSFGTGDESTVLISSADLMTRNTERRVEIACRVQDETAKARIANMLEVMMTNKTNPQEELISEAP